MVLTAFSFYFRGYAAEVSVGEDRKRQYAFTVGLAESDLITKNRFKKNGTKTIVYEKLGHNRRPLEDCVT